MRIRNAVDLSIRLSHLLNRERPIFSRMTSFDHPEVLEEGMVFALETYWPAKDGWSAARIEEEVVVTATGCEVITKFPAEELLVAGKR
jgi:Xaa-Pro aminopeptidase